MRRRKAVVILLVLVGVLAMGVLLIVLWGQYKAFRMFVDFLPPRTPCPTPVCSPDPDSHRIVFSSERHHYGYEIYVMNADGTCVTRLTEFPDFPNRNDAMQPRWSPNGDMILFELHTSYGGSEPWGSDTDLYVVGVDDPQVTQLTRRGENYQGQWSPDGSKIAFLSNRDGYWALYMMDIDGSHETRLTDIEVRGRPVWSSDGTRIAFTGLHPEENQDEVYVVDADGSSLTNLTRDPATDRLITWWLGDENILFVSNRTMSSETSQQWQTLYIMGADGTDVQRIIDLILDPIPLLYSGYDVHGWVSSAIPQLILSKGEWVYILDTECALKNSSGPGSLPEGCYHQFREPYHLQSPMVYPYWCSGDPQLTFDVARISGGHEDGSDIVVMNFDGTEVMNLTNCSADNRDPDWSP